MYKHPTNAPPLMVDRDAQRRTYGDFDQLKPTANLWHGNRLALLLALGLDSSATFADALAAYEDARACHCTGTLEDLATAHGIPSYHTRVWVGREQITFLVLMPDAGERSTARARATIDTWIADSAPL